MNDFLTHCFACNREVDGQNSTVNQELNLPVCSDCRDTEMEQQAVDRLNEGLAEDFVCGCI